MKIMIINSNVGGLEFSSLRGGEFRPITADLLGGVSVTGGDTTTQGKVLLFWKDSEGNRSRTLSQIVRDSGRINVKETLRNAVGYFGPNTHVSRTSLASLAKQGSWSFLKRDIEILEKAEKSDKEFKRRNVFYSNKRSLKDWGIF